MSPVAKCENDREERAMHDDTAIWSRKGATLSDKSARQEFGLSQEDIYTALRAGKLQFRESSMHGNPWFRLLRHEVEALVKERSGKDHPAQEEARKGTVRPEQGSQEAQEPLESHRTATD
jgi:hypothetical protein